MTIDHLQKLLKEGEGFTVEFKECINGLNNSVFETVCSFSNRYGGYLLLGVKDNGEVVGVNPGSVDGIKKNFANTLNNPQKVSPSLYLSLDEIVYDNKIVLYVYVPVSSQVERCSGKIFDRNEDGDFDVTNIVTLSAHLINRKAHLFTERKVFPYAQEKHLRLDLIPRVKQMAMNIRKDHPWRDMDDMQLLRSAGLYEEDVETGQSGFNLAGILLFGRDEVIQSCAPGYVTDALVRRENLDRYDDRLMVECNLIEAFDQLMEFISKHTLDRFFLDGEHRVGVRSWIAREIVSNILCHRDFSSTFPAKIIIEQDRIYAENWNRSNMHGPINPDDFTPQPKNPLIARFFVNIGLADKLGSGVRNLYKYTRIYTGGAVPELIEGDVFKTIVPLVSLSSTEMAAAPIVVDMADFLADMADKLTASEKAFMAPLLAYLAEHDWIDNAIARELAQKSPTSVKRYMARFVELGLLSASGENRGRRYSLPKK